MNEEKQEIDGNNVVFQKFFLKVFVFFQFFESENWVAEKHCFCSGVSSLIRVNLFPLCFVSSSSSSSLFFFFLSLNFGRCRHEPQRRLSFFFREFLFLIVSLCVLFSLCVWCFFFFFFFFFSSFSSLFLL